MRSGRVFHPDGAATPLTMTIEARTNRLSGKLINLLIWGALKGALENDIDLVKAFCNGSSVRRSSD